MYLHGGDIYRNIVEYDFSINVNPLGMPIRSINAAHEGICLSGRYPDYKGEELCRAIAKSKNIDSDMIILGNGAAELIYTLCYALKPKKALLLAPTFFEYERALRNVDCEIKYHYLKENQDFVLTDEVLKCVSEDTDIMFLCNPNNPTGRLVDYGLMKKIVKRCNENNVILCVDECFLPFTCKEEENTMINLLKCNNNLIVLRAFTKIYAMAGLRLGYAVTSNIDLRDKMLVGMQPWNTSIPAQMAGIEALKDQEYIEKTKVLIELEKKYLVSELSRGLVEKVFKSDVNYLLVKAKASLYDSLYEQGVMIRKCSNFKGLNEKFYRIAVRSRSENQELIKRWEKIKKDAQL